jgi:hypothetical protein
VTNSDKDKYATHPLSRMLKKRNEEANKKG